ncbi:UDP binding domain-containing protein [Streptomyces montanisoli]|uniref:UDP binding domain-containing protein n=1 Tax=Streptomyces montanisoli TaxID=2798581 RepID=UPI0027DDC791|nr:UDP binding domain-containing protein [Streptomyces montanisoli]
MADLRESPALEIAERLAESGARVSYTDPLVPYAVLGGRMVHSVDEPGARAWDLVVLHTLQPGVRLDWLEAASGAVLDATCGATPAPAPGEHGAVIPPPPEDPCCDRPVGARPADVPAGGPA